MVTLHQPEYTAPIWTQAASSLDDEFLEVNGDNRVSAQKVVEILHNFVLEGFVVIGLKLIDGLALKDAVVSDLDEAFREDVEEEASDERRGRERHLVGAVGVCSVTVVEGDLIFGFVGVLEEGEELTPEQLGEYLDVDEEGSSGKYPFLAIREQAATGDDAMEVRMVVEGF